MSIHSDFLTQGPKIDEFEEKICEFTGAKYCVSASNGTAALHLAVAVLEVGTNSEGLTSPNSFVASSNCFIYNGLKPSFADIDAETYNIDCEKIKKIINSKTRVIIPVHFAGQPVPMDEILQIARKHNLALVEDAAHALGARFALVALPGRRMVDESLMREKLRFKVEEGFELDPGLPGQQLQDWASGKGVPFKDLYPGFKARKADATFHYKNDAHWSARGHRAAAEVIAAFLAESALVPAPGTWSGASMPRGRGWAMIYSGWPCQDRDRG